MFTQTLWDFWMKSSQYLEINDNNNYYKSIENDIKL